MVSVPGPSYGSAQVKKEQETPEGVVFIPHPPDLRKEPMREEWREEKVGGDSQLVHVSPHRLVYTYIVDYD